MSIITRSEASHRLRLIGARVTEAVKGARDGDWGLALDEAEAARELLNTIIPHLEEAYDQDGLNVIPVDDAPEPVGSLGYCGRYSAPPSVTRPAQPPRKSAPSPSCPPPIYSAPPAFFAQTAKVRAADPPPRVIITPPPAPPAPPKPAPPSEPEPLPDGWEEIEVNPSHLMSGVLTTEENALLQRFMRAPDAERKRLLVEHAKTRKPVRWRVKKEE